MCEHVNFLGKYREIKQSKGKSIHLNKSWLCHAIKDILFSMRSKIGRKILKFSYLANLTGSSINQIGSDFQLSIVLFVTKFQISTKIFHWWWGCVEFRFVYWQLHQSYKFVFENSVYIFGVNIKYLANKHAQHKDLSAILKAEHWTISAMFKITSQFWFKNIWKCKDHLLKWTKPNFLVNFKLFQCLE